MIEKEIYKAFNLKCKVKPIKIKGLPLYMISGRKLYHIILEDTSFLLVELSDAEKIGSIALKKQLEQYSEKSNLNVAYCFNSLTRIQRDALISKSIPFISFPDQIYLPFLGVMLSNRFKNKLQVRSDSMMPATQCLFLYLLYNSEQKYVIKKEAAEKLKLTRTSITRASEQLKQMGLISEDVVGKEIRMMAVESGVRLYELAKDYLINPVQKIVSAEIKDKDGFCMAGESVLSKHTLLARPKEDSLAIYKGNYTTSGIIEIDPKWQEDVQYVNIELWKYDPVLFAKNGEVDPVSLAMSLKDNEDERVQGELETFLEEYEW